MACARGYLSLVLVALLVAGCTGGAPDAEDPLGVGDARGSPGDPPVGATDERGEWAVGMRDLRGSRAALQQSLLTSDNVDELGLKWSFRTNGSATGTPTVRDGVVYAATWKGVVYALDADTGELVWRHDGDAQVDAPVTLWEDLVLYGDAKGRILALDAETGEEVWRAVADTAESTHVYATVVVHESVAYVGVASDQESIRLHGDKPVDFRGSMLALDARTGGEKWRTRLVPEGLTGAPVWGTPVVAEELGLLIFGTGNAYTEPAHENTDAIIALRLTDGTMAWSFQATANDFFTQANPVNPDWDFGSTPSLFQDANGTLLIGLGQKSSRYWALDAETGKVVWKTGKPQSGQGIIGGSAYAEGIVVVPQTGLKRVEALDATTGVQRWAHETEGMVFSAPAIVPGAVLAADSTGDLYALGLGSGDVLWSAKTGAAGGVFGGLSVADGMLFVPTVEKGFLGEHGRILAYAPGAKGGTASGEDDERPPHQVGLLNVAFQPDELTVAPGTRITWVNEDAIFHTATSGWDAGATFDFALQPGASASYVFDSPGTYVVYCKPHASPRDDGSYSGMAMTIVVEDIEDEAE